MAELYSFERYLESYKKIVLTVLSPHVDTLTWWDTWSWDVCPSCICVSRSWFRHFWTSRTPQRWDSWPQDLGVCHYRRGWCPRPSSYLVGFFFPRPGESLTRFPTSERRRSVSSFEHFEHFFFVPWHICENQFSWWSLSDHMGFLTWLAECAQLHELRIFWK